MENDKQSLCWKDVLKLADLFRGIAPCKVGDGSTVLFWSDVWNDNLLQHRLPRLFSFAKNTNISVAAFLQNASLENQFHLPPQNRPFRTTISSNRSFIKLKFRKTAKTHGITSGVLPLTRHLSFTTSHTRMSHPPPPRPFVWIWDSKCANKIKVFTWLLLMDRLNVRNILRRKRHKFQDNNYYCVPCSGHCEETTFHLFFSCSFSARCWQHLGITWRFDLQFHAMMEEAFNSDFFMEFFIIGAWQIWKERNNLIFSRATPSFRSWKVGVLDEAVLQSNRFKGFKKELFLSRLAMYR
jgi:hypothetical protein